MAPAPPALLRTAEITFLCWVPCPRLCVGMIGMCRLQNMPTQSGGHGTRSTGFAQNGGNYFPLLGAMPTALRGHDRYVQVAEHAHPKRRAWHPLHRLCSERRKLLSSVGCHAHGFAWA